MAACLQKKSSGAKGNGGVCGGIVPPKKHVDNFPLMTYVSKNCAFDDASDESSVENEEVLRAANDRRVDELLSKAMKNQAQPTSSNEEADRKSALELIHSLELARNSKETWKVPEPNPKTKDLRNFLHPLKRSDKEDDYFSGIRKVKQAKERKRCRSDEVVLLDNGRLVPKNGSVEYSDSDEVAQIPLKFNLPLRSKSPRVPSVGLPFTPGPPLSTSNNAWLQKSGTELFSNVQSQSLLVNGEEDRDLALAIAESIRTAKEEHQRKTMLETLYQSQNEASAKSMKPVARAPPAPSEAPGGKENWDNATPSSRRRSMSVDSANQIWDEEMSDVNAKGSPHDTNNNKRLDDSGSATQLNNNCLEQRPRHCQEKKTSKSPPPPLLAGLEKTVSLEGTVITLQAPDKKKHTPMKESKENNDDEEEENIDDEEEKLAENLQTKEESWEEGRLDGLRSRESCSKPVKEVPKTSHVPERFDCPKISSSRLPTSRPTGLMAAMKNFTLPSSNERNINHSYVGHAPRTTASSTKIPPLLVPPKEPIQEGREPLVESAKVQTAVHNDTGHTAMTTESSTEVPSVLLATQEAMQQPGKTIDKIVSQDITDASRLRNNSTVPEIVAKAATAQSEPPPQQPATPSPSTSLEELSMAQAQVQLYQRLLMQQAMACVPQVLQNGQNFGGANGLTANVEKQPQTGQADTAAAAGLPNSLLGSLPRNFPNFSNFPNTMTELQNPHLGGIPGLSPGSVPGFPPVHGGLPGLDNFYPGLNNPFAGLPNPYAYAGIMPGQVNNFPGVDPFQGAVPSLQMFPGGLPDPSGVSGMPPFSQLAGLPGFPGIPTPSPNVMPSGHSALQNPVTPGFQMNPLSNMQGLQSNLPGGLPSSIPTSLPTGLQNCNSFGGFAQSLTPQPGSTPLMVGRGRGRLANSNAASLK